MPTPTQLRVAQALAEVYTDWIGDGLGTDVDRVVEKNPFAFIVGVILDGGGLTAAQAWAGVVTLASRLRREEIDFTPAGVAATNLNTLKRITRERPCVHRFPAATASFVKQAAQRVVRDYGGDADAVFAAISAREVFHRLLRFKGIGDKKANMAVRLLVDEMGRAYEDIHLMNVPVDVQVVRVFRRAGLALPGAGRQEMQDAAVALYPAAPWTLDAAWQVGNVWCRERKPHCDGDAKADKDDESASPCPLAEVCPRLK